MKGFIFGFITGVLLFTALHYQFIVTKKDVVVVAKGKIGLVDTFVDTRKWSAGDYLKHPKVALALRKKGIGSMFENATKKVAQEVNRTVSDAEKAGKKAIRDVSGAAKNVENAAFEASNALGGSDLGEE